MTETTDIASLRALTSNAQPVFVKDYDSNAGRGGGGIFVWRTDTQFLSGGAYGQMDDGIVIKSTFFGTLTGRWVRFYEGFINVNFFGALGRSGNDTTRIQKAIDFAELNAVETPGMTGSTVYIPNGNYFISKLILKSGVTIVGESFERTIFYANTGGIDGEYMFEIESGVVTINISRLNLQGLGTLRGGFLFEAKAPTANTAGAGGLMNSRLSDLFIYGFKGHGIFLKGGGAESNYLLPNQFNIFENVRVFKDADYTNSLKMTGQQGQITFLNCQFDGFKRQDTGQYALGKNIHIQNVNEYTSAVISFINTTIQDADYGVLLEWAENITFDNCWFENLGVAIMVNSRDQDSTNNNPCRSITLVNNRFANAAGYGSLPVGTGNIKPGQCINVLHSYVTANNNYVCVTEVGAIHPNSSFLVADTKIMGGITAENNVFQHIVLGKTFGIMQILNVEAATNSLNCSGNKLVFVSTTTNFIKDIYSMIRAGEYLAIRADQGPITLKNTGNIAFTTNNPTMSFTINNGEMATFIKIDNIVGSYYETYQLVSIQKVLS